MIQSGLATWIHNNTEAEIIPATKSLMLVSSTTVNIVPASTRTYIPDLRMLPAKKQAYATQRDRGNCINSDVSEPGLYSPLTTTEPKWERLLVKWMAYTPSPTKGCLRLRSPQIKPAAQIIGILMATNKEVGKYIPGNLPAPSIDITGRGKQSLRLER